MEDLGETRENVTQDDEVIDVSVLFDEKINTGDNRERKPLQKASSSKASTSLEGIDTDRGNAEIICSVCGERTTYKDWDKHKNTNTKHRLAYAELAKKNRKDRKTRAKRKGELSKALTKPAIVRHLQIEPETKSSQNKRKVKETYHLRIGNALPDLHHLYIVTLSTYFALQYSLSKDNRDFRISVINSDWNEFGDIVIEFYVYGLIEEIQAIQCKQVQTRSSILIPTLAAEMGKFSIKIRCDILEQLKKRNNYDKAYFKLFTVSSLQVTKDDFPKFVYDDEALKYWKNEEDKEKWKDKELKIPEYKKTHLLNTTEDSDDICIFKVVDGSNKQVSEDLNRFSMFTHQQKLEGLRKSVRFMLRNEFDNDKDISKELIKYVNEHFRANPTCRKLSKKSFLLKIAELLLKPYLLFPENVTVQENLDTWNNTLQNFDISIIRNQLCIVEKIHKCFNYILQKETQFSEMNGKLKIEKAKISKQSLSSIIFEKYEETLELSSSQAYLALWKAKFIPLILLVNDETELNTIRNVITFLHEALINLKFIIITDLKVDVSIFPDDFKIFLTLKDLLGQTKPTQTIFDDLKRKIEIDVCGVPVLLEEIFRHNPHFVEKISPDVLLNMVLKEYSFKYVDASMNEDVIADVPLVLSTDDVDLIQTNHRNEDEESHMKNLSFVVDIKGKPAHVRVPPVL